ncbi:MAG: hypothetical protein CL663_06955 [Bacteroidetes bacterium]|nr:hypothetical protein [Bacteroidota bacterium]|tara:strand:- start:40 stop:414 length:375 start_codon:yes stop_codon:yes gene_type:complete
MKSYSLNEKDQILVVTATETLNIKDIIDHYLMLSRSQDYPKDFKCLIDCRNATFEMDHTKLNFTTNSVNLALQNFDRINEAILVEKPFETVIANLFEELNGPLENYTFQVFSTEEAALNWLKNM